MSARRKTKSKERGLERFTFSKSDPRWQKDPKGNNKVRISAERFGDIFTDPAFTQEGALLWSMVILLLSLFSATLDKYGRPVDVSAKQLYEKLYHLEEDTGKRESKSTKRIANDVDEREEEEEEREEEEEEEEGEKEESSMGEEDASLAVEDEGPELEGMPEREVQILLARVLNYRATRW